VVAFVEVEAAGKVESPSVAPAAPKSATPAPAGTKAAAKPAAGESSPPAKGPMDTRPPMRLIELETAALAPDLDPETSGLQPPPVNFGADTVMPDKVPHASPAVRLFARELGVDLFRVTGSARKGRITREDVQGFVKQALAGGSPRAAGGGGGLD